jgi:hypothetical protein
MKRRHAILLGVVAVAGWEVAGCERALPTEPDRGLAAMRPATVASPAAALELAGAWTGAITFHAFDDPEEGYIAAPCDGLRTISTVLAQSNGVLTGQFATCAGALELRGVIVGGNLVGTLGRTAGASIGRITGSVSSNRISFFVTQPLADEDDFGKDNDGDGSFRAADVILQPRDPAERTRPVLAGGGLPTHSVAVSR